MRIPRLTHCLLALVCTLAGCTQTGGFRSAAAGNSTNPNIRTVASIGDKPIPIVTGEPGLSERSETDEIDPPPASGARISGRVLDDRGRPVPNATVRLAAGSSPSGKANYATTDRSGAFTLRGLRAGTYYTVIAEYDGQRGTMSGRMEAKAPDTDVRISLRSRENQPDEAHSTIRPAKSRAPATSDDEDDETPRTRSRADRYNSEDLEPPAAEATSMLPRRGKSASGLSSGDELPPIRAGWNPQRRPLEDHAAPKSQDRATSGESAPGRSSTEPVGEEEDDGPNPLPPALQPRKVGSTYPGDSGDDPPLKIAQDRPRTSSRASRQAGAVALAPDDLRSGASGRRSSDRAPQPMPDGIVPNSREMRPDSFAPIRAADPSDSEDLESRRPAPRARRRTAAPAAEARSSRSADSSDENTASEPRANDDSASRATDSAASRVADSTAAARRPTWRDVSTSESDVPVDESVQLAANVAESKEEPKSVQLAANAAEIKEEPKVVTPTSTTSPSRRSLFQRLTGSKPAVATAAKEVSQAFCRFDPTDRRLVELRLPDLEGKIVSLKDLDADLVLLDFWGSWCKECRTSIPHLAQLQAKYGKKRLRVIGVACERGSRLEDRQASAAKAASGLKINYPVLVSSMDGSCPVQQGMQIHFYPTMVLLDHSGKIIRREQGATDATLARIDRAIETALK